MQADPRLLEFIEAARAQGASDETLVGMLKGRGWSEEAVFRALGARYEKLAGVAIPAPKRATASAKDAFLYLLAFSTLATWTIALGSLLFTLIDRWLPDPLAPYSNYAQYTIASSAASILVAFPIYVIVTWLILADIRSEPEKLESGIRKWLTYLALLIASGVIIGDLVAVLTYFLRGELTDRFVCKALVVVVIAGSVFWYYLSSVKRPTAGAASAGE